MRRWLAGLVGLAAIAAVVAAAMRVPLVQDAIIRRVIARAIGTANHLFADDALRVLLCGTSAPLPHPTRAKACVAVFAAGRFWVVDTGPQSWNRLALSRIDGKRIRAGLFTPLHSHHIRQLRHVKLPTLGPG